MLNGNLELLRIMVRNLLDNAIRYVPGGGKVRAGLAVQLGQIELTIKDNGPGVATAEREKLGQRFHRFGPQTADGVGLGLSIVQRIAELHGAELAFGDGLEETGLGVKVRFSAIDSDR